MDLRQILKENRGFIDDYVAAQYGDNCTRTNDEGLYDWARSRGAQI